MPDDSALRLGDKGQEYCPLAAEAIDQIGFVLTTEGCGVD